MVKYIDNTLANSILPVRNEDANKGSFLKVLNIAGCTNYSGAAYLSSLSVLKAGGGFVSLACPDIIIPRISSIMPEVTYIPLNSTSDGFISVNNEIKNISDYGIVSAGCGIGTDVNVRTFS